ncbi:MAG: NADPH-dependent 7-cyano-7-deazaguanine reductase QueF [Puniceicoccaceae bacterium]|nr:MAG: NADPH-dependent 7-cyano-7-deazaguanine reductase QueF [Puniceicoccaceae bacterium]
MSSRDQLEVFPNPREDREFTIEHVHPEFTSMCPKTGQPDFGEVTLRYTPGAVCVELKSLKLYLNAYRNEGIYYEAVTNQILDDLVAVLQPRRMTVVTRWRPRGGLHSVITAEYAVAS